MFLATMNKAKRLLLLSYIDHVTVEELRRGREDVAALAAELPEGVRILADFSQLESMDVACAPEIGKLMELAQQNGVRAVVRVMPDPSKDIGMNILSHFHYRERPQIQTVDTMDEAAKLLSL
jgi:anti-anti-sigma regulatory factor